LSVHTDQQQSRFCEDSCAKSFSKPLSVRAKLPLKPAGLQTLSLFWFSKAVCSHAASLAAECSIIKAPIMIAEGHPSLRNQPYQSDLTRSQISRNLQTTRSRRRRRARPTNSLIYPSFFSAFPEFSCSQILNFRFQEVHEQIVLFWVHFSKNPGGCFRAYALDFQCCYCFFPVTQY
jgi:hypothetical protein